MATSRKACIRKQQKNAAETRKREQQEKMTQMYDKYDIRVMSDSDTTFIRPKNRTQDRAGIFYTDYVDYFSKARCGVRNILKHIVYIHNFDIKHFDRELIEKSDQDYQFYHVCEIIVDRCISPEEEIKNSRWISLMNCCKTCDSITYITNIDNFDELKEGLCGSDGEIMCTCK